MPLVTRVYIRTALAYLALSLIFLTVTLANQGLRLSDRIWALQPVAYHLLAVGWTLQLIVGVAHWMFPVLSRAQPRGDERLTWLAYAGLNAGLLLRVIAEPAHTWHASPLSGAALVLSGILQASAAWLLVLVLWPRVRSRPSRETEH